LQNPPTGLRPGLSSTAKITTAQKKNVVTIPIQALAERTKKDLDEAAKENGQNSVTLAADRPAPDAAGSTSSLEKNPEILGVFVVRNKRAQFAPLTTGITGVTDIEVTSGLQEGDQIITGSYKTLRTLKPDTRVKVDNSPPKTEEEN
jgi:HlyD family secretion protein